MGIGYGGFPEDCRRYHSYVVVSVVIDINALLTAVLVRRKIGNYMTVAELLESLKGAPLECKVVFQGNTTGEEDGPDDDPTHTHTICVGYVYSGFYRNIVSNGQENGQEFVIDCAITDSEGGIIPL